MECIFFFINGTVHSTCGFCTVAQKRIWKHCGLWTGNICIRIFILHKHNDINIHFLDTCFVCASLMVNILLFFNYYYYYYLLVVVMVVFSLFVCLFLSFKITNKFWYVTRMDVSNLEYIFLKMLCYDFFTVFMFSALSIYVE